MLNPKNPHSVWALLVGAPLGILFLVGSAFLAYTFWDKHQLEVADLQEKREVRRLVLEAQKEEHREKEAERQERAKKAELARVQLEIRAEQKRHEAEVEKARAEAASADAQRSAADQATRQAEAAARAERERTLQQWQASQRAKDAAVERERATEREEQLRSAAAERRERDKQAAAEKDLIVQTIRHGKLIRKDFKIVKWYDPLDAVSARDGASGRLYRVGGTLKVMQVSGGKVDLRQLNLWFFVADTRVCDTQSTLDDKQTIARVK